MVRVQEAPCRACWAQRAIIPDYAPLLKDMGVPKSETMCLLLYVLSDSDLDYADMAYEWLYGNTESHRDSLALIESHQPDCLLWECWAAR